MLYPLLGACLWASVLGYKPVIIVHGLFDSSEDFKNLKRFINQVSCIDNVKWFGGVVFAAVLCSSRVVAGVEQNVRQALKLV